MASPPTKRAFLAGVAEKHGFASALSLDSKNAKPEDTQIAREMQRFKPKAVQGARRGPLRAGGGEGAECDHLAAVSLAAALDGFEFEIPDRRTLGECLEERRRIYERDLGHPGGDRYDSEVVHLVARTLSGEAVAGVRVFPPYLRPFEIEEIVDLDAILSPGRVPAQVGGFWIREDHRQVRRGHLLYVGMLKLAYDCALRHGATDLVLYTYERLVPFYRGALFRHTGFTVAHPHWGEVVILHLDVGALRSRPAWLRPPLARLLDSPPLPVHDRR